MVSSSSSSQQNNAFSGIEAAGRRRVGSESSKLYDVFINHRGPDVKQTLATQLYNSLQQLGIEAFLDSEEKELGNSFPSIIETAIHSAFVHIAIFSKGYAHSPWCMAELLLMIQTKAKIIPVFYEVEPWELRHIEKGVYADAFIKYEKKGRYLDKLDEWKEALRTLSSIAGEEFNSDCKNIVAAVRKEVQRKQSLHIATYPVGLEDLVKDFERRCLDELVQDFENQCVEGRDKAKVNVVGIFGMGGAGKTTLAKELFNRKKSDYREASFLFDVRDAAARSQLPSLQLQLLKDLFHDDHLYFTSTEQGTSYLKDRLQRSPLLNFLIVVDDIDHVEQLDALLVMDILNNFDNILVIVTTRDDGVLKAAGITVRYYLKRMDRNNGSQLFCWHAFGQSHPHSGYEKLVKGFVDVCGGLPLSLQVLGRHVHGRDQSYWSSELIKVKKTLPRDVKKRLKISFDALEDEEKQVFMDIACFFVGRSKTIGERVWEGLGWNALHALETLKDKCLVNLDRWTELKFEMHDHLRDLGREMACEPGPHHRLWRPQDLESTCFKDILAKANVRCFHSIEDDSTGCRVKFFLGQPDSSVQRLSSLLWLQLKGNGKEQPSIPSWIPLQNLQYLHIKYGKLKTLWENPIQAPSHLKELVFTLTSLKELPDLFGISDSLENGGMSSSVKGLMSGLEKLEISHEELLTKILISGFHYTSLESIKLHCIENLSEVNLTRVVRLNRLYITNCLKLKRLKVTDLTNLVLLSMSECPDFKYVCLKGIKCLKNIAFHRDVKVKYFKLDGSQILKRLKFDYEELVKLSIRDCPELDELPVFRGPRFLENIIIDGCGKFESLELFNCQILKSVSCNIELRRLCISHCRELGELPSLSRLSCLEEFKIYDCDKLQNIMLPTTVISLSVRNCRGLQRVAGTGDLTKLTNLCIGSCENLKSVSGNIELRRLRISDCPELEELPTLSRHNYLEEFVINSCEKVKNIEGIEELHVLEHMQLSYLSNVAIRNCMAKLKSVPSRFVFAINGAEDSAGASSNQYLFSDFSIALQKIGVGRVNCVTVVSCFVVVLHNYWSVKNVTEALSDYLSYDSRLHLREGECLITVVDSGDRSKDIADALFCFGKLKKWYKVFVKEGDEWKIRHLVTTIFDMFMSGTKSKLCETLSKLLE